MNIMSSAHRVVEHQLGRAKSSSASSARQRGLTALAPATARSDTLQTLHACSTVSEGTQV